MLGIKRKGIAREQWRPLKKMLKESPVLSGCTIMKMENAVILIDGECSVLIRHSPEMAYFDVISFIDTVENLKKRMGTDSEEEAYFRLQDTVPGVSFMYNDDGMVMVRGIAFIAEEDIACRCTVRLAENCFYVFRKLLNGPEESTEEKRLALEKTLEDTFVQHQTMNNGSMPTTMVKLGPGSYEVTENDLKNVISCEQSGNGFVSTTLMERITDIDPGEGSFFQRFHSIFSGIACPSIGIDRKGRLFYGIHIDKSLMNGMEVIFTSLYNRMEISMAEFARIHSASGPGRSE